MSVPGIGISSTGNQIPGNIYSVGLEYKRFPGWGETCCGMEQFIQRCLVIVLGQGREPVIQSPAESLVPPHNNGVGYGGGDTKITHCPIITMGSG